MDTPSIPKNPSKSEYAHKTGLDSGSQAGGPRKAAGGPSGPPTADTAEFTTRAQMEASRGRAAAPRADRDRQRGGETDDRVRRASASREAIADSQAADSASREASARILAQPALAARAQANSDGATVLAMLQ